MICLANNTPCWVYGTGYRVVIDNGTDCAIDDAPMNGKMPLSVGYEFQGLTSVTSGFFSSDAGGVYVPPADISVQLSSVPVPGSLALMLGLLALALIARLFCKKNGGCT